MLSTLRSFALLASFIPVGLLTAQDTLRVQTLTFSDITARRGWYQFPDSTHQYRKVLMHHTLKCDAATTQDQFACGEWDYLTYNLIHEHTGVLDSTAQTHPLFKVGAMTPASIERATVPFYHTRQMAAVRRTTLSTENESTHTIGAGDLWDSGLLQAVMGTSRSQYLYLADELNASGLQAGPVHQLRFTTDDQGNGTYDRFTIRLKNTGAGSITAFDGTDLVTAHEVAPATLGTVAGEQVFTLAEPFVWDGSSNILVDLAATRQSNAAAPAVRSSGAPAGMAVQAVGLDGYLQMNDDLIGVDATPLAELGTSLTVMFRVRGDAIIPTVNTSMLEAVDAQGRRILNVHLPWSDGRVYWDAGNDGGGFDRIDKVTTMPQVEGQWNHWAFVKNTATGSMKIYYNGALWHSGTGKTKPMGGITKFRLGSGINGEYPYPGAVDEINVFATEVTSANILAWKDRAIDGTHPNAEDLLYSFHCDELPNEHQLTNSADPAYGAWAMGTVQRAYLDAPQLLLSQQPIAVRPELTFVQGTYTSALDTVLLERQEPLPLLTEEFFEVAGNVVVPVDTVFGWSGGMVYTYGPDGLAIDSMPTNGVLDVNDTLDYYAAPFEVVNDWEIGRFITPYGIGLTLGPNGFRWTFDVTDYQWLLRDSVDLSAGNQQELIDLEFELIEGIPPREVVNHQRPWGGLTSRSYADLDNDVALPAVEVALSPNAAQWSLRTRLTGHGHNSNTGDYPHCCEWKNNSHYVYLNGTLADQWNIWQTHDCALNPVYPQGGTWLNSREGWCPGDLVKDHEVVLTGLTPGGMATLDYDITPVPSNNQGMGAGNYVINMDLMEFGPATHALDAEIVEVKRPSSADMQRRNNPICYAPLVVLRNAGAQDLTAVTFTYGVSGGAPETYTWTGLLRHMERTEVELPVPNSAFWVGNAERVFTVSLSAPNGTIDQHVANDIHRTDFTLPVVYAHDVVLHYKTNNRPTETSVRVRDISGNVIFSRTSHVANTQYIDTLDLGEGCYTFEMLDTGNDGLEYWADSGAGSGFCRLKKPNGAVVKYFEGEFGRTIHWPFTIGYAVGLDEPETALGLTAYPNPTAGAFTLHVDGMDGTAALRVVDAQGRSVQQRQLELYGKDQFQLDLSEQADGIYQVQLNVGGTMAVLRIVKQ